MSATDVNVSNIIVGHGHLYVDGVSVGALNGGLFISKATTVVDISIDQLTIPVRQIPTKEDFVVKTNLSEATLANLQLMWNIPSTNLNPVGSGTGGPSLAVGVSTGVYEHKLTVTGVAPNGRTRIIHIYRAISVDSSEHGFFKDKETLIPVTFRCLADTTRPVTQELATIYDV